MKTSEHILGAVLKVPRNPPMNPTRPHAFNDNLSTTKATPRMESGLKFEN